MITEIVTFKLPDGSVREDVFANFEKTAPIWRDNPDLIRKNYLFDADAGIAGGVYLWKEKSHAQKWHGAEFRARVKKMYGAEPRSQFFETPIVVDNLAGEIAKDSGDVVHA
jgi:hypothetical protein